MSTDSSINDTRFAWIIARPITGTRIFRLLEWASHRTFFLCYWAVLVTRESTLDLQALNLQQDDNSSSPRNIGVLWELSVMESNQIVAHIHQPFTMSQLRREWQSASIQYIGTTELTDGEITNAGTQTDR
jgi:hypothetical protein